MKESTRLWQEEWENTTKGATTKSFFPSIQKRLKMKIILNFTSIVTGHGITRASFHRFKIMEDSTCPCNTGQQTTEHLIFQCPILTTQRQMLINSADLSNLWPVNENDLVTKHLKHFTNFTNSIDFDQL